jgi:DNA repair protein RadA/Sms
MSGPRAAYQCQACGVMAPKWAGQCADCGAWNTFQEVLRPPSGGRGALAAAARTGYAGSRAVVQRLSEVATASTARVPTGLAEFDRVLGGGLVPGSVVLLGGDPGIGKSTLLLQTLAGLAGAGLATLYVTGEESPGQVAERARRLELPVADLRLLAEVDVDRILGSARDERPQVMVVDSIQTLAAAELGGAPGGVGQVRECAARLVAHAKTTGTAVFLVGHVTKDGALAGPRVLEHMVDTVLYFEGDTGTRFRCIRAIKNRYGAVNELGVFAMDERGLREVSNPSALFLSRHERPVAGAAVTVTREGTRPLLVEVQALVDASHLAQPRRVAVGLDGSRLALLLAVLNRHAGVTTHDQDVFVNVVGGVRLSETAADLALVAAVLSSLRDRPLPQGLLLFGELGLAGEVRPVQGGVERLREAAKHGFRRAIVPRANAGRQVGEGIGVTPVATLGEALAAIAEGA